MTADELKTLLAGTGLPVTYLSWPTSSAPALPWIAFAERGTKNFEADGIVYYVIRAYSVAFCSKTKDAVNEAKIESVFKSHGIPWEKTTTHLDDEQVYETIYEIEV